MKRLRRWLFNLLAVMSLLLCLATTAMWIRSYWRYDSLLWTNGVLEPVPYDDWRTITCSCGGIKISHDHFGFHGSLIPTGPLFHHDTGPQAGYPYTGNFTRLTQFNFRLMGVQVYHIHNATVQIQSLTLPLPAIFFLSLFLPAVWTRRWLKRRRQSKGIFCPKCGYDLRATPGRCPECGTIPNNAN